MKFMMNGALTIGTLDGANIEIREEVGDEHFFLFGLTEQEVGEARRSYNPQGIIRNDANLGRVISLLETGHFNQFEPGIFDPILNAILSPQDPWMVAADFTSYVQAQERAADAYRDQDAWITSSILNTACSGKFSTDRTMQDYNREIWQMQAVAAYPVE
jgi:starch phosphorylase